jgi:DNA-binding NtrC family response regulator
MEQGGLLDFLTNRLKERAFVGMTEDSSLLAQRGELSIHLKENVFKIPSLSQRKDDIPPIVFKMVEKYSIKLGLPAISFDESSMRMLLDYSWPSNVLELSQLVEQLIQDRSGGVVKGRDLPERFRRGESYLNSLVLPKEGISLKKVLGEIEDSLIYQAMEKAKGNKNKASKLLGLNRTTLVEKLKKRQKAF